MAQGCSNGDGYAKGNTDESWILFINHLAQKKIALQNWKILYIKRVFV